MAFSAILRTGESFGAEHLIAILRGESDATRSAPAATTACPPSASAPARSKAEWQTIFRQLMGLDLVRPDPERHGAFRLTEAARAAAARRGDADAPRRHRPRTPPARPTAAQPARPGRRGGRGPPLRAQGPPPGAGRRRRRARLRHLPRPHADRDGHPPPADPRRARAASPASAPPSSSASAPTFLEVLTGDRARRRVHPARRRLAGQPAGPLFDRLHDAQVALARGADGRAKPLNCTHRTLALIAEERPATLAALERIQGMGPLKTERFGEAFLAILRAPD